MKRILIVRHAERPDILPNTVGDDVMLTDAGVEQSKLFISLINDQILSIRTSPIGRCVQTAESIAKTANFELNKIEKCRSLGDPGFMIQDADLAWQHWLNKGSEAVNQYLLSGNEVWGGFYDLNISVKEVFGNIKHLLGESSSGTHLWITHDTILATLASRIGDSRLALHDWPDFLGYLEVILDDDNQIHVSYIQSPALERI